MSETTTQPIPIIGQFFIHEESGKRYKFLMVEEVKEELEDWEIVSKINRLLAIPRENAMSDIKTDALFLINLAIEQENKSDKTFGPYKYYWHYNSDSKTVTHIPYKRDDNCHIAIQFAASLKVLANVVVKLGVDIFRIAAGVEKS